MRYIIGSSAAANGPEGTKEVGSCGDEAGAEHWYATFFVRVPTAVISLELCTTKFVGI
jgi:hypothetical protein